jgi:hypothetical protein
LQIDLRCVEERDDEHGPEVVSDGEGSKEDDQVFRHAPGEKNQNADRERDVRRHRNAPTGRSRQARIDSGIDKRRHNHAAECGNDGQDRVLQRGQLAHQNLAFELEADKQEEERHQAVVHERVP